MSAIWESANWTRQFGIRQTGNRQLGMLPHGLSSVCLLGQKMSTTWQEIQSDPTSLRCQNYKGRVSITRWKL